VADRLNVIWNISNGIAFFGFTGFGLFILRQQFLSKVNAQPQHYALFATAMISALWSGCALAYGLTGNPALIEATFLLNVLRYGGWFVSILTVLVGNKNRTVQSGRGFLALALASAAIMISGLFLQYEYPVQTGSAGWQVPRLALIHALSMPVFALFLLEQLIRNVEPDSRWNLKPLSVGLAGACFFDLYLYADALMFGRLDLRILGLSGFINVLVIPLFASSIARSRDWTRRIKVSRKIVIHTTMLLVVGGFLLAMAAMGYLARLVGGDWGEAFRITLIFVTLLALFVLMFSGAMRARIRVWVVKHFFRYRYDYRDEWLKFTQALSAHNTPDRLAEQIIRELAEMVESPAGSLWLRDSSLSGYRQFSVWNMTRIDLSEPKNSAFCTFLESKKWVINLDERGLGTSQIEEFGLPDWLTTQKNAWLVVPLLIGNELIGFLILAHARARFEVNWEVRDLLKTAGSQAAGHLAQLLAVEALLETKKFETFNRMSAFVVHDLKNIVAQLSLMLNNATRHRDNPEFQKDMLETVEHSLGRMRRLMSQLQEGGEKQTVLHGVDLRGLFDRLRTAKQKLGRDVKIEVSGEPMIQGDEERLERIFGHLVQNALDATENNQGVVQLKAMSEAGVVKVEILDSGCGMTEEFIRERLFKPFQTTKSVGMGIGAYEAHQYFRELGGEVSVQSELGAGTSIRISLPVFNKNVRA
jgi:putative PEP-CTERM system histidine kinase